MLNSNSVHFNENARRNRFPEAAEMAAAFKAYLARHDIPFDMAAAETGIVFGAYGVRSPGDVDFVSPLPGPDEGIIEHHQPDGYAYSIGDLLLNPAHHFHFWGLKFVSLRLVADMKRRRNAGHDMVDLVKSSPF